MAINEGAVLLGMPQNLASTRIRSVSLNCCCVMATRVTLQVRWMATLEEFKALRDGVPAEVQAELYKLMTADPDDSIRRMVEIAAEKG